MGNIHEIKLVVGEDAEVKGDIILAGIKHAVSEVNKKYSNAHYRIKEAKKGGRTKIEIIDTYSPFFRDLRARVAINPAEEYESLDFFITHNWDWLGVASGPKHYDAFIASLTDYIKENYKQ